MNDCFIVFSRGDESAPLDWRTFGNILPNQSIVQAIVRPLDGDYQIIHCHTGREEEIYAFAIGFMRDNAQRLSRYGSVIYKDAILENVLL